MTTALPRLNSSVTSALWRYHTDSQALSGLVPTKSGLLFAGDAHGNLLVLDATNGSLLKRIDAGGALNNGLISYAVEGAQYVAAAVGGATENPSTVAGPYGWLSTACMAATSRPWSR
jgi:alcohol dehydrogenase (cytochrome c)